MQYKFLFVTSLLLVGLSACHREKLRDLECDKPITENSLLQDKGDGVDYIVTCPIVISDGTLTVEDGVHIQFEGANAGFIVENGGALKFNGTQKHPILLDAPTDVKGAWMGVVYQSNKEANELNYVKMRNAGSVSYNGIYPKAAVTVIGEGKVGIRYSEIMNNEGYGVYIEGTNNTHLDFFENNTIGANTEAPLSVPFPQIISISYSNTLNPSGQTNGKSYVEVWGQKEASAVLNELNANGTIYELDVPYRMNHASQINNAFVQVQTAATFEFENNASLVVVSNDTSEGFTAVGNLSQQRPVTFTKAPEATGWRGIHFAYDSPKNVLYYCKIEYGGSQKHSNSNGQGNIVIGTNLYSGGAHIESCVINNSLAWGIQHRLNSVMTGTANFYNNNLLGDIGIY